MVQTCRDVEERAATALQIVLNGSRNLLDIALNHLTLGRAGLYRAILERPDPADDLAASAVEKPSAEIEQAVDGLRRAGQVQELPKGRAPARGAGRRRGGLFLGHGMTPRIFTGSVSSAKLSQTADFATARGNRNDRNDPLTRNQP